MSKKEESKGMTTKKKTVDDFIGDAKADQPGRQKKTTPASTETRGRPGAEEPMKIQNFYLPVSLIELIQKMADSFSNAAPGKGNKSQFGRKVFEDLAKEKGLLK